MRTAGSGTFCAGMRDGAEGMEWMGWKTGTRRRDHLYTLTFRDPSVRPQIDELSMSNRTPFIIQSKFAYASIPKFVLLPLRRNHSSVENAPKIEFLFSRQAIGKNRKARTNQRWTRRRRMEALTIWSDRVSPGRRPQHMVVESWAKGVGECRAVVD